MPTTPVLQHSVVYLSNGNSIVHISEKAENLFAKVEDILGKFNHAFKVKWMDISEGDGITTLSLILEPCDAPGEKVFLYRADRALFFSRVGDMLKKMHIAENDVSKCVIAESMGYITAAYSYEKAMVVSER